MKRLMNMSVSARKNTENEALMNPAFLPNHDVIVDQFFEPLLEWGWTAGRAHQKDNLESFLERIAHFTNGFSAARSDAENNGIFTIRMPEQGDALPGPSGEIKLMATQEGRIWSRFAYPNRMIIGHDVLFINKNLMPEAFANVIQSRLERKDIVRMEDIADFGIPLPSVRIISEETVGTPFYRFKLLQNNKTWRNCVDRLIAKINRQESKK